MKRFVFFLSLILCAFIQKNIHAQMHINHTGQLTIDGKTSHSYTVQFAQNGDTTRRVTSYFDSEKHLVLQETTRFRAKPLMLYSNYREDFRTGETLIQSASKNIFSAKRRERKGAEFEEKSVTAEKGIVSALVTERIEQNMDALERGETVNFTLALPLRNMVIDMNIVKVRNEDIGGIPCSVISLAPSNFVYKTMMGEPSYFTFETAKPHRYIRYKGILGLPTAEGKQQSGLVMMKY